MNGRTVSETSVAATLTAKGTKSPLRARMTCSAMVTPALSWASAVDAPRWGATTTDDSSNSGDSVVGSLAKTSRPAPWIWPDRMASASAASSTMPPRAVLMIRSPGLALARRSLPMSPSVSAFLGRWTVTKSDTAMSSSSPMSSTPMCLARSADTKGS